MPPNTPAPLPTHCIHAQSPGAPLVVFLHGFMGAPLDARPMADGLGNHLAIAAVALPGHGGDIRDEIDFPVDFAAAGALIMDTLRPMIAQASQVTLVGYSMGARFALYLALTHPGVFHAVLAESGTPGIADAQERVARATHDAAVGREIAACADRDAFAEFLAGWYARPPFDDLNPDQRATLIAQRSENDPKQLGLAVARMSVGLQPNLWPALAHLDIPLLAVCGERDLKFRRIAESMAAQSPRVAVQVMAGCGHNVHFEHPDAYTCVLRGFLEGVA